MDGRRFVLAALGVYTVLVVGQLLLHGVLLHGLYGGDIPWRRPEYQEGKRWLLWVGGALFALAFAYVYARGVERKPWPGQGVRYGIVAVFLTWVPLVLTVYVYFPIPYTVALAWLATGGVHFVLLGLVAAALYPAPAQT